MNRRKRDRLLDRATRHAEAAYAAYVAALNIDSELPSRDRLDPTGSSMYLANAADSVRRATRIVADVQRRRRMAESR